MFKVKLYDKMLCGAITFLEIVDLTEEIAPCSGVEKDRLDGLMQRSMISNSVTTKCDKLQYIFVIMFVACDSKSHFVDNN